MTARASTIPARVSNAERMRVFAPVAVAGAPGDLPVDGHHPQPAPGTGLPGVACACGTGGVALEQPPGQGLPQGDRVDAAQQTPQCRAHRPSCQSKDLQVLLVEILDPIRHAGKRDRPRAHRHHGYCEHPGEWVADPTRVPGIGHVGQCRQQPESFTFRDRRERGLIGDQGVVQGADGRRWHGGCGLVWSCRF